MVLLYLRQNYLAIVHKICYYGFGNYYKGENFMKLLNRAAAFVLCTAAMLTNLSAAEITYVHMPFEGDTVQTVDVYTGQNVMLICDESGEKYVWGYSKRIGNSGSMMSSPIETTENTYSISKKIQYYHSDFVYHVSAVNGENYTNSKYVKINVLNTKGDVDGNGDINKADAKLLLEYLCGNTELDEKQLDAADYNTDGKHDILDVIKILK